MSAFSSHTAKQRLSAIMDALTRAAVAEICEMVDESYAQLCAALESTQRENEDLKKKLHVIEAVLVRCDGSRDREKTSKPEELDTGMVTESGLKEQRRRSKRGRDTATPPEGGAVDPGVTVVQLDELPDVVLIKDENSDNDDASQDVSTPVCHSAKRPWTGSEAVSRKSPPKAPRVALERQKKGGVSVFTLESPQHDPGHSDRVDKATSARSNLPKVKQETAKTDSARQPGFLGCVAEPTLRSNIVEPDLKAMWTNLPDDHMTVSQPHEDTHQDDNELGLKLVSVLGSASSEYEAAEAARYAPYKEQQAAQTAAGSRGKRFMCCVCSKTYATAQNLDVHMRIHTGMRPFGCEHCGKKFLQSAHLKSHLSIHTGERPYVCLLCSRSFIVKHSLKLHMKKCHMAPS